MSAYRGSWGQTRTESVHVPLQSGDIASVTVWRAVNVDRDPALAARLEAGTLNRVTLPDGTQTSVEVPVLIHHEGRALTLLLSPALRHRELAERAAVLTVLAEEPQVGVPAYALSPRVAYSWAEVQAILVRPPAAVTDAALGAREHELTRREAEHGARQADLAAVRAELSAREKKVVARELELTGREQALHSKGSDLAGREAELAAKDRAVATREGRIAVHEKELARRDVELARREADLARREADLARREADLKRRAAELDAADAELDANAAALEPAGDDDEDAADDEAANAPVLEAEPDEDDDDDDAADADDDDDDAAADDEDRGQPTIAIAVPGVSPGAVANGRGSSAKAAVAAAPEAHHDHGDDDEPEVIATEEAPAFATSSQPATVAPTGDETGPFQREDFSESTDPGDRPSAGGVVEVQIVAEPTDRNQAGARRPASAGAPPPAEAPWLESWLLSGEPSFRVCESSGVRLVVRLGAAELEPFVTGQVTLTPRLHLYRLPTYALIAISVAQAHHATEAATLAIPFDVSRADDHRALRELTKGFRFTLSLYDKDYLPVSSHLCEAPLADNVTQALAVAEEHLRALPAETWSFPKALLAWQGAGFDRYGKRAHTLTEESFQNLPTPGTTRSALGIVAYWSQPEMQDQLVLQKSFPLLWWRKIQQRVVTRAVEYGLALSPELADVALAAGLSRTRRELAQRQLDAFSKLCSGSHDLSAAAEQDNWRDLLATAQAAGVSPDKRTQELADAAERRAAEASEREASRGAAVAGEIARPAPRQNSQAPLPRPSMRAPVTAELLLPTLPERADVRGLSASDLLALLEDKEQRKDAALELSRRGDASSSGPVFAAVRRMTRGEAVRVLPAVVSFGESATPHLLDGLRSRKGYLRHGCALALGVLRSADGIEPLCDLLLTEPTDVWREIARALGEVGSGVVMSLAARVRTASDEGRERIAWALACLAARGGRGHVETLAHGRDALVATAARKALDQAPSAAAGDREVRGGPAPRDQTVNRAFSRRFFEVLAGDVAPGDDDGADLVEEPDEILLDDEDMMVGDDSARSRRPQREPHA
ncbi:MAG: hypothetical protein IT370_17190 [Deltaproteobacteria bacterium]|nr:hypothetical protein [Deltaproteobacteria bacterium]